VLQTDGDKKIELKPGLYMEHDEDVRMILLHVLGVWHAVRSRPTKLHAFGGGFVLQVGAVVVGFDRYFNYYKVQ
jgi:phosphoglycolate phosphatase